MRKFVIAYILGLVPLTVTADSSLADLSNDKVLEDAVADIRSMKQRDLEVAIEFIAACMEPTSTERNYHCSRNFTIAWIKIDKAPEFSRLIRAVFRSEVNSQGEKAKGSMESIGANIIELRRSEIFFELRDAARARYQQLAK